MSVISKISRILVCHTIIEIYWVYETSSRFRTNPKSIFPHVNASKTFQINSKSIWPNLLSSSFESSSVQRNKSCERPSDFSFIVFLIYIYKTLISEPFTDSDCVKYSCNIMCFVHSCCYTYPI